MSAESVRRLIARAVVEPEFRETLLRQPAVAAAGYDLSLPEQAALANLTPENFSLVATGLADRLEPASAEAGPASH
jgi:hypothetical protein